MSLQSILYVTLCVSATGGCIRLTGMVYEPVPDPLASHFVRVVNVSGTTIELADGSRYRVLGIAASDGGASAVALSQKLKAMVVFHPGVLLETHGDAARVVVSGGYSLPQHPGIVLFPQTRQLPPNRADVGAFLIREGYVRADTVEMSNGTAKAEYQDAETEAKHYHRGIWAMAQGTQMK